MNSKTAWREIALANFAAVLYLMILDSHGLKKLPSPKEVGPWVYAAALVATTGMDGNEASGKKLADDMLDYLGDMVRLYYEEHEDADNDHS